MSCNVMAFSETTNSPNPKSFPLFDNLSHARIEKLNPTLQSCWEAHDPMQYTPCLLSPSSSSPRIKNDLTLMPKLCGMEDTWWQ